MAVELNAVYFNNSGAPTLVILHGLLGSARNWMSTGKALSQFYNVAILDLRNHGKSPHTETMGTEEMVEDVEYWIKQHATEPVYLLGHSLGGKIAMLLACKHPQLLKGLIIEDIVPKDYDIRHDHEFAAMNELNLKETKTRGEVEKSMEKQIHEWEHRQFLMMNLIRTDSGFNWQINLPVLTRYYQKLLKNTLNEGDRYMGRTLFICGEHSHYAKSSDEALVKHYFPNTEMVVVPNAKHNVHADNMGAFVTAVSEFGRGAIK